MTTRITLTKDDGEDDDDNGYNDDDDGNDKDEDEIDKSNRTNIIDIAIKNPPIKGSLRSDNQG